LSVNKYLYLYLYLLNHNVFKAVKENYAFRYFKVQTPTGVEVTASRPRPVIFEVKAKARPLRGKAKAMIFLSPSRP